MLTVAKVTSGAAAGYAEYLDGRAQPAELGDYYLKGGERVEAPGRWAGGAEAVGANPSEPVAGDQLRALMLVRRPDTGEALRRVGGNGEVVAAIDATFSAPKSVSAVWALASPELRELLEHAHERAIDRTLAYAVRRVPMIRERIDSQTVIRSKPANVVATSWRHTTARAVDGRPPDPQLHSHVLLHAAVRRDRRIVAIESRAWFVHRRELGAAYRTELARELADLGFAIQRGTGRAGRYFEIEGVPSGLTDRWSSRHHQVRAAIDARLREKEAALVDQATVGGLEGRAAAERLEALRHFRQLAAREDRYMAASSRAAKPTLQTHGDLDRQWCLTAQAHGFDSRSTGQLRTHAAPNLPPAEDREVLRRLVEFDATFAEREARAVALEASAGSSIDDALSALERLRENAQVLALANRRGTTAAHRATERQTVTLAQALAGGRVTPISEPTIDGQTVALDAALRRESGMLTAEQRVALGLACSDHQLAVIEGQAGTGKSTVLAGVARAHQAEGREIIVTSTAALAAERLADELRLAGVPTASYSTVALHAAIATGHLELGPETTVIHDEAALASTREQHQLLSAIQESGARLVEVGDPRQSQAVGPGGLWPHLEHAARSNDSHVELTRNVRAQDPADRRDQKLFRDGQHEQALRNYHTRGRVTVADDRRRAEDAALEAAHEDHQTGKQTLIITQTSNEHLDELNARAQAIRSQNGELKTDGVCVPGRPYTLHAGDEIQIRHSISHQDIGRVRNGTTGQIIDLRANEPRLTLRLHNGRHLELDPAQVERADLRLAYVLHPVPAQGHTTDTTHVIIADHATQEGCYVAITRAREATHIYASQDQLQSDSEPDLLIVLAEQMSHTEPEVPSIHTPLAHEHQIIADQHREARFGISQQRPHIARSIDHDEQNHPERPHARVLVALGARPDRAAPNRDTWDRAAAAIEQYCTRYEIEPDNPATLGPEPEAGQFAQRYDRRQAAAAVLKALDELRPPGRERVSQDRVLTDLGLDRDQPQRDRSNGWEP